MSKERHIPDTFRGYAGEPQSELEVAYLFALVQPFLPFPFAVRSINDRFPDCVGIDPTTGKRITIEFEVFSRNFVGHKHPMDGCDYIVCWTDNWPASPIPVISLRSMFEQNPELQSRFLFVPAPGSLAEQMAETKSVFPAAHEIVSYFLDDLIRPLAKRLGDLVVDGDVSRHYLIRYAHPGANRYLDGKGLMSVYPDGRLTVATPKDVSKHYGQKTAPPIAKLRACIRQIGTLRNREQCDLLASQLEETFRDLNLAVARDP